MKDTLSEVFDVEPLSGDVVTTKGEVVLPEQTQQEEKIDHDYDATRNNLHSLLVQGQDALVYALEIAKQSEHPRAFEVVGNLIKQLSEVNAQLLELHEKKQKLDAPSKKGEPPVTQNVTNNALFVGSTSDLNKFLDKMKKGE